MHEEREGVYMGRGRVCVHGERVSIGGGGVCMHAWGEGGCIWKRWSACMRRGSVCIWKGWSVRAWGEGGCVHMEEVECACMGRGCV